MPTSSANYADNLLQSLNRLFDGDNACIEHLPGESAYRTRTAQSGAQIFYQPLNGSGSESASREPTAVRQLPRQRADTAAAGKADAEQLLEKIKQRNREKQARHRARIKKELQEVESKVNAARANLQHAKMCQRRLELQASALRTRVDEATETLAAGMRAAAKLTEQAPPSAANPKPEEPAHSMQMALSTSHKRRWQDEKSAIPTPISSYKACEPISCASIAPYMATVPNACAQGFNLVQQAMNEYQRVMSSRRSLEPQDVCWFVQYPYTIVTDFCLSYSAGFGSPECCVTLSLCISVASVECMFLVLELEAHEASSSPGATPPPHPFVEDCTKLLEAEGSGLLMASAESSGLPSEVLELIQSPPAPDPDVLARLHAVAGVNSRFPIESAVQQTLGEVCREHRTQMSLDLWRAVIMKAMVVASTSIYQLQKAARAQTPAKPAKQGSATSTSSPEAPESEGITWTMMDAANLAVLQLELQACHRILHERVPQGKSSPQKSVKELQGRIYELFVTVGIGTSAGFKANPNLMRTIIMQQHFGHFEDFVQSKSSDCIQLEREQMRVITYLDIKRDQKPALSAKWHQWLARRKVLDKTLADAIESFNESLPSGDKFPRSLMAALEMFDDEDPNGVDLYRLRKRLESSGAVNRCGGGAPLGPPGAAAAAASATHNDTESTYTTECVSRPCIAINPCDPGSSLSAAEAHYGTEEEGFGCSATANPARSARSRCRATANKVNPAKRPSSWESNNSVVTPSSAAGAAAAVEVPFGRRRSNSLQPSPRRTPRSGSMSPSVQHAHSGLQHTLTSTVTTTKSGLRQFVDKPAVTSSSVSEDLKLPGKTRTLLQRTASAAARTAQHAQSVLTELSEQEAPDTDCIFNSLQSINSSHDGTVDMPDGVARVEGDWWLPENRCVFAGESMKKLMEAEQALDTIISVHDTDNLMSQEMMLPAWELTPIQHARIFSSHVELATAKLDAIRVFRTAAYDLRCEELFAGL